MLAAIWGAGRKRPDENMAKLDLGWTIKLQLTKEQFYRGFHKIVQPGNQFVLDSFSTANNINRDFFGMTNANKFSIWKRRGIFDLPLTPALNGEIQDEGNAITLT